MNAIQRNSSAPPGTSTKHRQMVHIAQFLLESFFFFFKSPLNFPRVEEHSKKRGWGRVIGDPKCDRLSAEGRARELPT